MTDEEREEVIKKAIYHAEHEKGLKMYREVYSALAMQEKVYPVLTPRQFKSMLVETGVARSMDRKWKRPFAVDSENESIIQSLCLYFTNDARFNDLREDFSLNKGIMLLGSIGCGKTQLMELCSRNQKQCYSRNDCTAIVEEYSKQGESGGAAIIAAYSGNVKSTNKDITLGQPFYGRFFDDLGTESTGKHYGNTRNVMAEIIQNRYKNFPHDMTHFTSNLVEEELLELYGPRVYDRIREMCNIIIFPETSKSRRA